RMVPLRVHTLPSGVLPTPDAIHFSPTMMNFNSPTKDVMLTNCGTGSLMIAGTHLEGDNANDFIVVGTDPALPATLIATDAVTLHLLMNPHGLGTRSATLVIEHSMNNTSVPLDGTSFGGSDTPARDRETYYACSTGHPVGGWPIALAWLALR